MIRKNILSFTVAIIIAYLSLTSSGSLDSSFFSRIPHFDKIAHFLMYFGFMSVIIFENRNSLTSAGKLLLAATVPFFYGVLMEILQSIMGLNRTGDIMDVLFNSLGIIFTLVLYRSFGRLIKGSHLR